MKIFWRQLLSRQLTPQTFSQLYFSVLGLGDSSYAKFNYVAKRLFRRLEGLGKFFVACGVLTSFKENFKFLLHCRMFCGLMR